MKAFIVSARILVVLLLSLAVLSCSSESSDDETPMENPDSSGETPEETPEIASQDKTDQTFSIVRIGAAGPGRSDVIASTNNLAMPASSSAFYRDFIDLDKTVISVYMTNLSGGNENAVPPYPSNKGNQEWKAISFMIPTEEEKMNGTLEPNGKLIKKTEIDIGTFIGTASTSEGSDLLYNLDAGNYTIERTGNHNLLGMTVQSNDTVNSVTFDEVDFTHEDLTFMDKFIGNFNEDDMSFSQFTEFFSQEELEIYILQTSRYIAGEREHFGLQD